MATKDRPYRYVGEKPQQDAADDTGGIHGGKKSYGSLPMTPEEADAFREQRKAEAAAYMANPPQLVSGHNIELMVTGATIVGDEIRLSVLPLGIVQRPGVYAEVKPGQISVVVPATVTKEEGAPPTRQEREEATAARIIRTMDT